MERITKRNLRDDVGEIPERAAWGLKQRPKEVTETHNESYEKSRRIRTSSPLSRDYQGLKGPDDSSYKRTHRQDTCFQA